MLAVLNLEGIIPELSDSLNSKAKEGARVSAHLSRTVAGRPSCPVALRSSSALHSPPISDGTIV